MSVAAIGVVTAGGELIRADENLVSRPFRFLSEENLQRLEALRAKHDPDGIFASYLIARRA